MVHDEFSLCTLRILRYGNLKLVFAVSGNRPLSYDYMCLFCAKCIMDFSCISCKMRVTALTMHTLGTLRQLEMGSICVGTENVFFGIIITIGVLLFIIITRGQL